MVRIILVALLAPGLVLTACSSPTRTIAGPTVTATTAPTATRTITARSTVTEEVTAMPDNTVTRVVRRTRTVTVTARPKPARGPASGGVTYEITATSGSANDITYTTADGNIEQQTSVALPWSRTVPSWGDFYQVSAQNSGGGSITCKIIGPNGGLWTRHSSGGEYAVVSCSS